MATKVLMPQLGEAIDEATITKWLKSEGETVEQYEAIVEVNTDKVDTEIPAPVSGTLLKILHPVEGTSLAVGMVLAYIGEPGEVFPTEDATLDENILTDNQKVTASGDMNLPSKADSVQSLVMSPNRGLGFISPVVSKIAEEYGVDLQIIQATGLNGRITKKDVLAFIQKRKSGDLSSQPASNDEIPGSIVPHNNIRWRIAEHMVLSKKTSPHVTTVFEADMSKVVAHRAVKKDDFAKDGSKLTFTAYFVAATALALKSYPKVNSSWSEEGLILHRNINIGLATSLGEEGLIVPVIKKADDLSLLGITRSINDLANRARSKGLQPDEVSGGTFTITNHGISGSLCAMPIINQPQCAILGVGKIQKRVIVLEDNQGYDTIAVRPMVYLTLTFDHRILDGAVADYFLSKVVETLENWT